MNNNQSPLPPQTSSTNEELKELITKAINDNKEAITQIPTVVELKELAKDVEHHNRYIKYLGAALFTIFIGCLGAYMRLDDKIESETKYLQTRIDNALNSIHADTPQ